MTRIKTGQTKFTKDQIYDPEGMDNIMKSYNDGFSSHAASGFLESRYKEDYPIKKYTEESNENQGDGTPSMANRYSLFKFSGLFGDNILSKEFYDSPDSIFIADRFAELAKRPTTSNIIEAFSDFDGMTYSWSDFLYAKYHKHIPNNYLITLRRYAYPQIDNLFDPQKVEEDGTVIDLRQPELARAVTWMSPELENGLDKLLSWTNGFSWEEIESEVQVLNSNAQGIGGSSALGIGTAGFGVASAMSSVFTLGSGQTSAGARQMSVNNGFDPIKETYANHTEGPLNVIKSVLIQKPGLKFEQEFEINFHYNLQSHSRINPKMAFLDILTNFLVLTYNNAPFWGGATRYTGNGSFGSPLGNHKLLEGGDISGFLGSIAEQASGMLSNLFGDGKGGFSLGSVIGGIGNVAGDMIGGWLSKNLNTPQGAQVAKALLDGSPSGKWHLTVGNPFNPIYMVGNLVIEDAVFKLNGPLGRDDFPSNLTVTVKLKHARPRDKAEIEQMFNAGRGRLYHTPEDFPDILNDEGREPKAVPNQIPNEVLIKRNSNGTPAKSAESNMQDMIDSARTGFEKAKIVSKFVTES